MKHTQNVQVAIRVRPVLPYELQKTDEISISTDKNLILLENKHSLKFDKVYGPDSQQVQLFEELVYPSIDQFLSGYSASILAYGQTSSGKSYTIGIPTQQIFKQFPSIHESVGIIPRLISVFFQKLQQKQKDGLQTIIRVSYIEVYNEQLRDLLVSGDAQIQIREKLVNGYIQIYTTGNNEVQVQTPQEMLSCFVNGGINRATAQTVLNEQSSRSHAIFSIYLEQVLPSHEVLKSKLNIVDLAGSERLSKTGGSGQQFKEMVGINQGLLALGNVIKVLSEKEKPGHVPYRDSKLTRLLQDSMGGTARCTFIACVSPSKFNYDESQITLKYAARAKNIVNMPVRFIEKQVQDGEAFSKLYEENQVLKDTVAQLTLQINQQTEELSYFKSQSGVESAIHVSQNFQQGQQNRPFQRGEAGVNQTLSVLLDENRQSEMKALIEEINERVSNNQFFSPRFAGELYTQLTGLQFKQLVAKGSGRKELEAMLSNVRNNQIQIQDETTKLLFQACGFLLQYVQFENAYERQLLRNEQQINFSDQLLLNPQQFSQQAVNQILCEVNFTNQLKAELREQTSHTRLDPVDPLRFLNEEVVQTQQLLQNRQLIKQRLQLQTAEELKMSQQIPLNQVLILDVDEDLKQVQAETDLVATQPVEGDYDFENYEFIQENKSEGDENEEEEDEEEPEIENDVKEEAPEVNLEQQNMLQSIKNQQSVKQTPNVAELSSRLHQLESYFKDKSKIEIDSIVQEAERRQASQQQQQQQKAQQQKTPKPPVVQRPQPEELKYQNFEKPLVVGPCQPTPSPKVGQTPKQGPLRVGQSDLPKANYPSQKPPQVPQKIQTDINESDLVTHQQQNNNQQNQQQGQQNPANLKQLSRNATQSQNASRGQLPQINPKPSQIPQSAQFVRPQLKEDYQVIKPESEATTTRMLKRSFRK